MIYQDLSTLNGLRAQEKDTYTSLTLLGAVFVERVVSSSVLDSNSLLASRFLTCPALLEQQSSRSL